MADQILFFLLETSRADLSFVKLCLTIVFFIGAIGMHLCAIESKKLEI